MSILLQNLTKYFGRHPVVNDVSLHIEDGEFFVLLGPSGSGKSTILKLIAGLVTPDQGIISLHGQDVTFLPPQERRVGFVFQHYALFQHMTVAENVEFGLTIQKVAKNDRHQRSDELLDLVGLNGFERRYPHQLSGGQQQRVALARALANKPQILLLDEPLGALDAQIRVELRRSLRAIQRKLGVTTILVTHDQEEAFDLADRIGVMNFGRLLEVGTPQDLYQRPQTEFAASFLGTANLFVTNTSNGQVEIGSGYIAAPEGSSLALREQRVQVLVRPEDVSLASDAEKVEGHCLGLAVVQEVSFNGPNERVRLCLPPIPGVRPISPVVPPGTRDILLEASRPLNHGLSTPLQPGEKVWIGLRRSHVLPNAGLQFLFLTDGSLRAKSALDTSSYLAKMAHARVTLLGLGENELTMQAHLVDARRLLGSGLASVNSLYRSGDPALAVASAVEQHPYDLIAMGFEAAENLALVDEMLQAGNHHVLLVPRSQVAVTKILVYVSTSDPGNESILFTSRLAQHLGAKVTLLLALSPKQDPLYRKRAEAFLEDRVNTPSLFGLKTEAKMNSGMPAEVIEREMKEGGYDLLVMAVPVSRMIGDSRSQGSIAQVLQRVKSASILLIQPRLDHYPVPVQDDWEVDPDKAIELLAK